MEISESTKDVLKGAGVVILGHIMFEFLMMATAYLMFLFHGIKICNAGLCFTIGIAAFVSMFFVWIGQFLYVVPLSVYFYRKGKTDIFKGVWIMAGLTFLLCGGICSGILLLQ